VWNREDEWNVFVRTADLLFHASLEDFDLAGGWAPYFLTKNYGKN